MEEIDMTIPAIFVGALIALWLGLFPPEVERIGGIIFALFLVAAFVIEVHAEYKKKKGY